MTRIFLASELNDDLWEQDVSLRAKSFYFPVYPSLTGGGLPKT